MATLKLTGYSCDRCKHTWVPRRDGPEPRVCPRCKSPYWNTPRKKVLVKKARKKAAKA